MKRSSLLKKIFHSLKTHSKRNATGASEENTQDYYASQWSLMWKKLKKHRLARFSLLCLIVFYIIVLFANFIAPQDATEYDSDYANAPPMQLHFFDEEGNFHLRPFVYGIESTRHPETYRKVFVEDREVKYPVQFFTEGSEYKFLGLFPTNIHLFGVEDPGEIFILGTDGMGRDLFSRIVLGSQVSLSIPLVGVAISLIIGLIIGGISGYFGGWTDAIIQRIIEIFRSFPTLPLWMALSAAIPAGIEVVKMYFYIVIIISFIEWTGLARVVRGQFMSLKKEEFVLAAKIAGVSTGKIIRKHLMPGIMSYLVVSITLAIPGMILAETAMSFLGLGIRSPATSWGVLLQEAQQIENVALYPWKLIPLFFVIFSVLCFNFFGDGLRDASDPYKK
ncbi:binding-protein-dependent transport system inner membrane protein [Gracilibacillus halophilus YIM-C55.5]|uniref:Binding-protein-dependent transport system inner membrane protein n=1 Tax=Gracilibacillus halophilus YIM-C55.5 TaxID=1308866 RepID=N4WUS6_9BACI|nr:ABC transporter permease [Gracilibacillus halophilus]ENH96871.1 binding-protein-dependent transport system inner membrane protein [Gracilibacillus halophilus YIM-C55.5]